MKNWRVGKFAQYVSKWTYSCMIWQIKKMTVLILTDSVFIIQDIKELNHFKDKNRLVHNESCQLNMKL